MANEFSGKIVVVAGGSRGIGRGIAAAFAAEGAQTVLTASSKANLEAAADVVANSGSLRPDIIAADLRREDGCKAVFDFVTERYGRCDILINSAGATRAGAFLEQSAEA
jgi:NAD(P)-dependent dehydrogenase (short-subunit alcohol dehydrogenase family)